MNVTVNFSKESNEYTVKVEESTTPFRAELGESIVVGGGEGGENGATFTPTVSEDGVISWSNDKGLPNPDPVDITGPVGPAGKDGADGAPGKDGAQWYFTQAYEAVLQYGNDGDLSVDLASPNLPVYKVDKANNQMVFTGAYLKGKQGDAGQWHFLETFEMALQYDFVNDGDIVVDLADPRLGIFKVDKVNNQMIFTGAYLKGDKGDKGDPYTLTQDDRNMLVTDVLAALPIYGGEVESV